MKKKILLLFVIGIIGFNSCKKEELIQSNDKTLINGIEKKLCISCGGGSWDIQSEGSNIDLAKSRSSISDTVAVKETKRPIALPQRGN